MKSKLRTVFLKQECVTRSVFICLGLVALIGAIVILCDGYKGDYLGPSAIIASYSFIVDIVFAYLAVSSLGREFQNRTINMIRVSSLSGREVILRKLLSFLVLSIVAAEQVEGLAGLGGQVSQETALSLSGLVESPVEELDRMNREVSEIDIKGYSSDFNNHVGKYTNNSTRVEV